MCEQHGARTHTSDDIGGLAREFAHARDVRAGNAELHRIADGRTVFQAQHARAQAGEIVFEWWHQRKKVTIDFGEGNPWQYPMGQAVEPVLQAMGVICLRIERPEEVIPTTEAALTMVFQGGNAVAVLLTQKLLGAKAF